MTAKMKRRAFIALLSGAEYSQRRQTF